VIEEIVSLFAQALRDPRKTKTAAGATRKPRGRKANEARNVFSPRRGAAQRRADR
jgi:hypothetical protein